MAFIAGGYTAARPGGTTLGQVENGFNIEWTANKRLITGDNEAATPQDAVYQGMECFVSFTLLEWNATGVADLIWPYSATLGTQGTVGILDSTEYKVLVLSPKAGTSAAALEYTFDRTVLAEGFPVSVLLQPDLRTIPVRLRVYPNASGVFFTQAAPA